MPALDRVLEHPTRALAALCIGQVAAWTLAPALTHYAPPLDAVEGYLWGRQWVVGTYKHPALPSWLLEASRLLSGAVGWPSYLVSQLLIAATYVFVFLLGRDLMDARRALAGTLLLAGLAYFNWPTPELNHNIVSMPLWAGFVWALWQAASRGGPGWWAVAGALAAASLYAKLAALVLLAVAALWILLDAPARHQLASPGPWIGLVVFAVLTAPLAHWLIVNDFPPLRYAEERTAKRRTIGAPLFLAEQLAFHGVMLLTAALAGLFGGFSHGDRPPRTVSVAGSTGQRQLRFLLVFAFAPVLLLTGLAVLRGAGLKGMWAAPMFSLSGLVLVALLGANLTAAGLKRIALGAAALLVLVPSVYAADVALRQRAPAKLKRADWPQHELSRRLEAEWTKATGKPLRIVAGDTWLAGLIALTASDRPSILTNGDLRLSPWVTAERIARDGMLVVWGGATAGANAVAPDRHPRLVQVPNSQAFPAVVRTIPGNHLSGELSVPVPRAKAAGVIVVGFAIVPPR